MSLRWGRSKPLVAAAVGALALDALGVCSASADNGPTEIDQIATQSLKLTKDLGDAMAGALSAGHASGDLRSTECLNTLVTLSLEIEANIAGVDDLNLVTSMMVDSRDEKSAISVRAMSANAALAQLKIDRTEVNQTAGECSDQAIVQEKARELDQLLDDASVELTRLAAK